MSQENRRNKSRPCARVTGRAWLREQVRATPIGNELVSTASACAHCKNAMTESLGVPLRHEFRYFRLHEALQILRQITRAALKFPYNLPRRKRTIRQQDGRSVSGRSVLATINFRV